MIHEPVCKTLVENAFQQREHPIKNKTIKVDIGNTGCFKPIFISKSLNLEERKDQMFLVKEYIIVFCLELQGHARARSSYCHNIT